MKIRILVLALLMLLYSMPVGQCSELQEAQTFFNQFVREANSYSPELLSFYEDNAKIIRMVLSEEGYRALRIPIGTYKSKMRSYSRLAKIVNYKNYYSGLKFIVEGQNIRIKGQRTPTTGGGALPMQMLLGRNASGNWVIKEEIFYTKNKGFLKFVR